ncbi:unnamed protein product [Euphydryas editha]|uniref:Peptidoglycan recognition protein family domain-containing protein n=1 Tax=Euphydryas editha TaxID=104508 RepID=A0AAU9UWK3_EUPED|nr:unnamed protein product [Euphydryas editha]
MNVLNQFYVFVYLDHESRHSSHHGEDDTQNASEETPLLHRFPRGDERINLFTLLVVGMMVVVLMSGLSIGVYLLIIEDNSENVLPPVQIPPLFVPRGEWDAMSPHFSEPVPVFKAKAVVIDQTDTGLCSDLEFCIELMKDLEENIDENKTLPYNFMISSDGHIYEYLGWELPSPLYRELPSLVIAFIGNFAEENPSDKQIQSAGNIITASVSNEYLDRNFTLITKSDKITEAASIQKILMNKVNFAMERRRLYMSKRYFFRS